MLFPPYTLTPIEKGCLHGYRRQLPSRSNRRYRRPVRSGCGSVWVHTVNQSFFFTSVNFTMYRYMWVPIYLSIHLPIYLSIHLSIYLSISLSIFLSTYPSIYLSIHQCTYLSILPIYRILLLICNFSNTSSGDRYACIYVPLYLWCIFVCMHTCMHACM